MCLVLLSIHILTPDWLYRIMQSISERPRAQDDKQERTARQGGDIQDDILKFVMSLEY
jgi:hypothetical protein